MWDFMFKKLHSCVSQSLLVAAMAASGATLACSSHSAQNAPAAGPPAMPVKVQEARATPVNDATEHVAALKSRDSAGIMPQVEGPGIQIDVHSGETVAAG